MHAPDDQEYTPAGPGPGHARPGDPQIRPLTSSETGFWAFLEYPAFWIPALAFMFLMLVVLIVLMITGAR
jgi:hypothetical protein